MRKFLVLFGLLLSTCAFSAAPALASLPPCTGPVSQSVIYSGQGVLESVIVGGGGKLFVSGGTETGDAQLLGYTRGNPTPSVISTAGPGPGGLAWNRKNLLWGYGNTLVNGKAGDTDPKAGLFSLNPRTGARSVVSDRLGMANGIARAADGTIYATNDLGFKVDAIRKGVTINGWSSLESGNGLVVGKNQKYMYVNQTFVKPSSIAKVSIDDPTKVWTFFTAPEESSLLLDGMARDSQNNLYVAVLGLGEIWKVTPQKQACVLATGLLTPSAVAISSAKKGFKAGNLYAVGFGGEIVQVSGATKAMVP